MHFQRETQYPGVKVLLGAPFFFLAFLPKAFREEGLKEDLTIPPCAFAPYFCGEERDLGCNSGLYEVNNDGWIGKELDVRRKAPV